MCELGIQFYNFIATPYTVIDSFFSPKTVTIYRECCSSIFSATKLLINKFRNTGLHNGLQSSYFRSRSLKLDGLAELIKAFKPDKQSGGGGCCGSRWYLLNDFHLLFYL